MRHVLGLVAVVVVGALGACSDDGGPKDAPDTVLDSSPKALTNATKVMFTFHATSNANGFVCRVDGGAPSACVSGFETTVGEGMHTFEVAASLNNLVDDTPAMATWKVDATAPDTQLVMGPPSVDNTVNPQITFTGNDPGGGAVTFECKLDTGAFAPCTAPDTVNVTDGAHSFVVRAVDAAGNVDPTPATHDWTVDTSFPDTMITVGPTGGSTTQPNVSFTFGSPASGVTFECSLDGGAFMTCTSPQAFTDLADGMHTFTVRAKNAAGTADPTPATRVWTVDGTAPDVAITAKPTDPSNDSTPSFSFVSTDATATFECAFDGGAFMACTSGFTSDVLTEGSHKFEVRAKDPTGNVSAAQTYTWTIDTMAPTVMITGQPNNPSNSAAAAFTFTVSDGTIQCKLDAGAFGACTTVTTMSYAGPLAEGSHTFTVNSTDAAGNVGTASFIWTIDLTAPTVTITPASKPALNNPSTSASFVFTVSDGTIQCKLDAGAFGACTSSTTMNYTGLSQGSHTFTVRSTDAAGNADSDSHMWNVDAVAPTLTITPASKPPLNNPSTSASFVFTVSDGTIECKLDAGAFGACTSPTTMNYTGLAQGSHTFTVRSTDLAGNVGSDSHMWNVDTVLPVVTITSAPPASSPSASAMFQFNTSEGALTCSLDGAAFTTCSSPNSFTMLGEGAHTFEVKATDLAGNIGTATHNWTIDTTGPVITFSSVPPARWPVNYYDVAWSANETTTYECSNNNGASWVACTTPMFVSATYNQSNTFSVRGKDGLGNIGAPATHTWAPADGLVLHYPFEQGSRQNTSLLAQRSGYSPDINTAGTTVVGGWAGTALRDTASATYIGTVRPLTSSAQGVYMGGMWVRLNDGNAVGTLWSNIPASNLWGHSVTLAGTTLTLTVRQNGTAFAGTYSGVASNQWVHIGVRTTGPSKGLELLVNGVMVAFVQPAGSATGFDTGQGDLKIGGLAGVDIDDVRFYNRLVDTCLVLVRGSINAQGACDAGRPSLELDFEGSVVHTGYMPYTVSNSIGTFPAGKLGTGFTLGSPPVPLALSEFAKFGASPGTTGHTIALWTPGASTTDTMLDFTTPCAVAAPNGTCGISVTYSNTKQFMIFMGVPGTGAAQQQQSIVPATPLDPSRTHNLVIAEKKSGGLTQSIRIYVDGRLEDIKTFGNGDVFAKTSNIATSVSNAGSIDELEIWPMDMGGDAETLCENGFDGRWDPATDNCNFTSN